MSWVIRYPYAPWVAFIYVHVLRKVSRRESIAQFVAAAKTMQFRRCSFATYERGFERARSIRFARILPAGVHGVNGMRRNLGRRTAWSCGTRALVLVSFLVPLGERRDRMRFSSPTATATRWKYQAPKKLKIHNTSFLRSLPNFPATLLGFANFLAPHPFFRLLGAREPPAF